MTGDAITNEIKQMLDAGKLDNEEAMRLLLVMVSRIQQDVSQMAQNNSEILERIKSLETHNERYPSLTYMWMYNRRNLIIIMVVIALVYTLIVSPWMISDIRHALLHMLGLPADLGINTPAP